MYVSAVFFFFNVGQVTHTAGATAFYSFSCELRSNCPVLPLRVPCLDEPRTSLPNTAEPATTHKNLPLSREEPRRHPPEEPDVLPLTALPALQVVEPRVTGSTVPAGHVRQTFTLPSHGVTVTLLLRGPVGIAITG